MKTSRLLVLVLAAAALALPACSSTSGSASTNSSAPKTSTITGEVTTTSSVSLDDAYAAAEAALKDLQFTTTRQSKDSLTGVLTAKTADSKTIDIKLTKKADSITDISVNAGMLERSLSETTMNAIIRKIGG